MALTHEEVLQAINSKFPNAILYNQDEYGILAIGLDKEIVYDVIKWLQEDQQMKFHFLTDLCGIHNPHLAGKELGVIYLLHSMTTNTRLRIKAALPEQNAKIKSVTTLHSGANWMERETYDFFGIRFEGHPDLRRILNMDEMNYFPLLKKYPLEDGTRTDKEDKYFGR